MVEIMVEIMVGTWPIRNRTDKYRNIIIDDDIAIDIIYLNVNNNIINIYWNLE